MKENTMFADSFSFVAAKPDAAPVESVRKNQLLRIAEQFKMQHSRLGIVKE